MYAPLVGSRYYPPAVAVLPSVPIGTSLLVRPEPLNLYDPNALGVWLLRMPEWAHVSASALEGYGTDLEWWATVAEIKIGHVAAEACLPVRALLRIGPIDIAARPARLHASPSGMWAISVSTPPAEAA
jgi:hypothetical protein